MVKRAILPLLPFFIMLAAAQPALVSQSNVSVSEANASIANATSYISSVNQSAFLLFYPNLSKAYGYLSDAKATYLTSPDAAILYSRQAVSAARNSYGELGRYREISLLFMLAFTIATAAALYKFMLPIKKRREK
jgi:hypothetical protein